MTTVNISSIVGANITWDTASFTWGSNSYTWNTAKAGTSYTVSVIEDSLTFYDLFKKNPTKKNLEACVFTELGKRNPSRKNLETCSFSELLKRLPTKKNLETLTTADIVKKSQTKVNKESFITSDIYKDTISFLRTLTESFSTTDKAIKATTKVNNEFIFTTGKNLIPPFTSGLWNINAHATVISDYQLSCTLTAGGQMNLTPYMACLPNTTYTLSINEAYSTSDFYVGVYWYDENKNFISPEHTVGNPPHVTFTTPSNCHFMRVWNYNFATSGTYTITNPQLEIGSSQTSFVPYCNEGYSDVISFLRTLSEAISFADLLKKSQTNFNKDSLVIADLYKKSVTKVNNEFIFTTGKNLMPQMNSGKWQHTPSCATVNGDYDLTIVGIGAWNSSVTEFIPCLPNTNYTGSVYASSDTPSCVAIIIIYWFDRQMNFISSTGVCSTTNNTLTFISGTVTSPSNAYYMRQFLCNSAIGTVRFVNPQIELGNSATSFVPYGNEVLKKNPSNILKDTFSTSDLLKKLPTKLSNETLHTVDAYTDVIHFYRTLAEYVNIHMNNTNLFNNYNPWTVRGANYNVTGTSEVADAPMQNEMTWKLVKDGTSDQWNGWEGAYEGNFSGKTGDKFTVEFWYKSTSSNCYPQFDFTLYKSDWSGVVASGSSATINYDGQWHFVSLTATLTQDYTNAIGADCISWNYSSYAGIMYINGLRWYKNKQEVKFSNSTKNKETVAFSESFPYSFAKLLSELLFVDTCPDCFTTAKNPTSISEIQDTVDGETRTVRMLWGDNDTYRHMQTANYGNSDGIYAGNTYTVRFRARGNCDFTLYDWNYGTGKWIENPPYDESKYQWYEYEVAVNTVGIGIMNFYIPLSSILYSNITDVSLREKCGDLVVWNAGKNVKETATFTELLKRNFGKKSLETLSVTEAYDLVRLLIKNISETLNFTEVDKYLTTKLNKENLTFVENYSDVVSFMRLVQESMYFIEFTKRDHTKRSFESFSTTEYFSKISIFNRVLAETLHIDEDLLNNLQKYLFENFGIAELYVDYIQFFLRAVENIHLSENLANTFLLKKSDAVSLAEKRINSVTKINKEQLSILENNKNNSSVLKKENVVLLEGNSRQNTILKKEAFTATEKEINSFTKSNLETLGIFESYTDNISFILRVLESFVVNEVLKNNVTIHKTEAFAIAEKNTKNSGKVAKEPLHFTDNDTINKIVSFHRLLTETINLVDILAKHQSITHEEAISFMSEILRRANATISDIVITTGDMTLDEFSAISTPAGFNEFKDFLSGDLTYKDALVKIIMEAGITTDRPLITDWSLNVDVPDLTDRGTATCSASSSTTVNFNETYHEPPEVNVTLKSGTVIASPRITEITDTGFTVELRDPVTGNLVAGEISWTSLGY